MPSVFGPPSTATSCLQTFDAPGYEYVRAEPGTPVLFSSPHSGRYYPDDFRENLQVPIIDLRRVEDALVDELFRPASQMGAGFIAAQYARSYVDLNRSEFELDNEMFDGEPLLPAAERSPRVQVGLGCIPRIGSSGHDIHAGKLKAEDADLRLQRAYYPYHDRLAHALDQSFHQNGLSVLIDCHSMPSSYGGRRIPSDFVLGDRFGSSCMPALTSHIKMVLEKFGYRVALNKPYAGGYLTELHGNPFDCRHAIQIEINRRLYLDERTVKPSRRMKRLKAQMDILSAEIIEFCEKKAAPLGAA